MSQLHPIPEAGNLLSHASTVPRTPYWRSSIFPVFLLIFVSFAPCFLIRASAQAVPTASRKYGFAGFLGGGTGSTDYGQADKAFIAGLDLEFFPRWLGGLRPSLEVRVTDMPGNDVGQKTLGAGFVLEKPMRRLHPYGEFEAGYGIIDLPVLHDPNYTSDNSTIYNFGGGVNIDVGGPFALKIDYQEQSWKLGNANSRLTPTMFTFGIKYTIPPHAFRSERY